MINFEDVYKPYCDYEHCSFPECGHTCEECLSDLQKSIEIKNLALADIEKRVGGYILSNGKPEDDYVKHQHNLYKHLTEELIKTYAEVNEIGKRLNHK